MTWIEFLIIYLACGSPMAVYRAMSNEGLSTADLPRSLAAALVWPGFAVKMLIDWFRRRQDPKGSLDDEINQTRLAMEKIAFASPGATRCLHAFRDVFDRYAGLTSGIGNGQAVSRELFEVSGHSKPEVAARILARRNREKLAFHRTQARNEFVDLISELSLRDGEIVRFASDLADKLGDADAVAELAVLIGPTMAEQPAAAAAASPASVR